MTWFTRLKTATKLIVAFCVVALVTATLGYASVRNMATLAGLTNTMYKTDALGLAHLKEANEQLLRISRAVGDAIIADSSAAVDARIADIKEFEAAFRKEFGLYQQTIL